VSYTYDRRKVADAGLESLVANYLTSIAEKIGAGIASGTHAHVSGAKFNEGHMRAEVEVLARAGDLMHQFRVTLSFDEGLQVIAVLDYQSMGAHGGGGRKHELAFDLSPKASPGHFITQIVNAALEQYQGVAARPEVEMRSAGSLFIPTSKRA
jgi:hypothetical protein